MTVDSINQAVMTENHSGARLPESDENRADASYLHTADPWLKSCVLTLDGGGIRGYASLWILKILMEIIEKVEKEEQDPPHESSFGPKLQQAHEPNGAAVHQHADASEPTTPPTRARTNSNLDPRNTNRFFRRTTSQAQRMELQSSENTESDGSSQTEEGYLPCHYFDYIAGTSTGGLNAIMLGRLRMRVEECLERYPEMARNIFSGQKRSKFSRLMSFTSAKYDSARLEEEIKKIVNHRTPSNGTPLKPEFAFDKYHAPQDLCKTVVVANEDDGVANNPYLFRTYPHYSTTRGVYNPGPADKHEIWKVARATSAAPTYFDPIEIENKEYSDGGVGNNNPVMLMLREVTDKAGKTLYDQALSVVVSIGAGQKPTKRLRVKHRFPRFSSLKPVKQLSSILKSLKDTSTDSQRAHQWVSDVMHQLRFDHYYRWTGGEEVGGLGMAEWHPNRKGNKPTTAVFIEQHVRTYMARDDIAPEVEKCARELVRLRRERISHKPGDGVWRRHAYCTMLPCPYCGDLLGTRSAVKNHITQDHPEDLTEDINLDSLVQRVKERHPSCRGGPL